MNFSPYFGRDDRYFWQKGVAQQDVGAIADLYISKFPISKKDRIVTLGSCFAQHLRIHLKKNGFNVVDAEPAPAGLPDDTAKKFGYGIFSARTGNIYTVRQLLQLLRESLGVSSFSHIYWEKDGRFFDPFRPLVEPFGLDSPEEVRAHRLLHLRAVQQMFRKMDVFVFTLGLTESWIGTADGEVYASAPGTIAGKFHPERYRFHNAEYPEILAEMNEFMALIASINPNVRYLLTVSPVSLVATASNQHVLAATMYSKSVLRAVAGKLMLEYPNVDYFPSYELIAGHCSKGNYYEENMRSVNKSGVQAVMRMFFNQHAPGDIQSAASNNSLAVADGAGMDATIDAPGEDEVICEEVLLEAFARKAR